jgi:hypothetical protein
MPHEPRCAPEIVQGRSAGVIQAHRLPSLRRVAASLCRSSLLLLVRPLPGTTNSKATSHRAVPHAAPVRQPAPSRGPFLCRRGLSEDRDRRLGAGLRAFRQHLSFVQRDSRARRRQRVHVIVEVPPRQGLLAKSASLFPRPAVNRTLTCRSGDHGCAGIRTDSSQRGYPICSRRDPGYATQGKGMRRSRHLRHFCDWSEWAADLGNCAADLLGRHGVGSRPRTKGGHPGRRSKEMDQGEVVYEEGK